MKFILFILLSLNIYAIEDVRVVSIPKSYSVSSAAFSFTNQGFPESFLECGASSRKLYSIKLFFGTAGKLSVCPSNPLGVCTSAGDTTLATAINLNAGDSLFLGYSPSTRSISESELTTFTRFDGDFVAVRSCVNEGFLK